MARYDEQTLNDLILRAVRQVLAEQGCRKKRLVYVVFEDSFAASSSAFLQAIPSDAAATLIVPDDWSSDWCSRLQAACPSGRLVSRTASVSLPLERSLTVYPAASRSFAAKAALGLDDTFETAWLSRCFAAGSKVHLYLPGLQKFSGREPKAYVERILSYYRTLLEYGITIGREAVPGEEQPESVKSSERSAVIPVCCRVLTAADIYPYQKGTRIAVTAHTIVTSLAKEAAQARGIEIVKA